MGHANLLVRQDTSKIWQLNVVNSAARIARVHVPSSDLTIFVHCVAYPFGQVLHLQFTISQTKSAWKPVHPDSTKITLPLVRTTPVKCATHPVKNAQTLVRITAPNVQQLKIFSLISSSTLVGLHAIRDTSNSEIQYSNALCVMATAFNVQSLGLLIAALNVET